MSKEIEVYGRELLRIVAEELTAFHKASAPNHAGGIIAGLALAARRFPFEASGMAHLHLAESLLKTFLELTGEKDRLKKVIQDIATARETLHVEETNAGLGKLH